MNELTNCKNCGAPLTKSGFGKYKCSYCGTTYESDSLMNITVLREDPGCVVIGADAYIDEYWCAKHPELAAAEVKRQLADTLADALVEHMKVIEYVNFKDFERHYQGQLRIVPEGYRY